MLPLIIPLISLASTIVPEIIGLFGGKRAGDVATEVSSVVQQVTGTKDAHAAALAISDNPALAADLKVKLEQIRQRYAELQIQDAQNERLALIETLKSQIVDRTRASNTMLGALKVDNFAARTVALTPVIISVLVIVGFFGFTGWMVISPPGSASLAALTLLNVVVGALVAGFTAVLNFWLGSSQGSRDKDKTVEALQVAQATQATETVRQVRQATSEGLTAGAATVKVVPQPAPIVPVPQPDVTVVPVQPGSQSHFDQCLPVILEAEGGFSDNPQDSGGPTMMGITQSTLADWHKHPVTADDVRSLTRDEAADIYRAKYWNVMMCDDMPCGLDLALFDYGVNSGPKRAIQTLQGLVGTEPDGVVGPFTLRATNGTDLHALIDALSRKRVEFLQTLSSFPTFGDGWLRRVDEVRKRALLMAA